MYSCASVTRTARIIPGAGASTGLSGTRRANCIRRYTTTTTMAAVQNQERTALAQKTLSELMEGNARFVKGELKRCHADLDRLQELRKGQSPAAIVLCCSDSRAPPELVFDAGLGDIFVVRVAGHVINGVAMGSIQYAVEHLGSRLIVVLGHSKCGAVTAAVDAWNAQHEAKSDSNGPPSPVLNLVEGITPACASVAKSKNGSPAFRPTTPEQDGESDISKLSIDSHKLTGPDAVMECVKRNSELTAAAVSDALKVHLPEELFSQVEVVAAKYELDDGKVELLKH